MLLFETIVEFVKFLSLELKIIQSCVVTTQNIVMCCLIFNASIASFFMLEIKPLFISRA